jgi:hypothetical protein
LPTEYSQTESARNFHECGEVIEESFGIHRGDEKRHGQSILRQSRRALVVVEKFLTAPAI